MSQPILSDSGSDYRTTIGFQPGDGDPAGRRQPLFPLRYFPPRFFFFSPFAAFF